MITPTDIANIIFKDCKDLGIEELCQEGNIPEGEVISERIVVYAKKQTSGIYWKKGFVEVNLCVPDYNGKASLIRLNELEHEANSLFDDVVSTYDGTRYRYSIESIGTEADTALKCHYVNVRILFEVLNVKL